MKIRFTVEARTRVRSIGAWWRRHGIVPDLFERELAEAQEKLLAMPALGVPYRTVRGRVVRRILMPKTQQHLYYSLDEDTIAVHMVWGARRGREPKL